MNHVYMTYTEEAQLKTVIWQIDEGMITSGIS